MNGQFTSPIWLPRDLDQPVQVEGPLTVDSDARSATVVCVLVQFNSNDPSTAVWVEGHGTWKQGDSNWSGTVSREGSTPGGGTGKLEAGGEVRGIAMATVVKGGSVEGEGDAKHLVPPSLETLTWCVGVRVRDEGDLGTAPPA
jgi:hypothetical protein